MLEEVITEEGKLERLIAQIDPNFFKEARWFQHKGAEIKQLQLVDYGKLNLINSEAIVLVAILEIFMEEQVETRQFSELYYLPLLISETPLQGAEKIPLLDQQEQLSLYQAVNNLEYVRAIDQFINREEKIALEEGGTLLGVLTTEDEIFAAKQLTDVSSNSLTIVKKDQVAKTFRRLEARVNPEIELSLSLQQKTDFEQFPTLKGYLTYQTEQKQEYNLMLAQEFVASDGDLWAYTQEVIADLLARLWEEKASDLKKVIKEACSEYFNYTVKLGELIARLHLSLAGIETQDFLPRSPQQDELTELYSRIKENYQQLAGQLRKKEGQLDDQQLVSELLSYQDNIEQLQDRLPTIEQMGKFIRCHGDLHLEQVLKVGEELIILDFEGEPTKSIAERRRKYSPLKDIAGMLRSYNYAAYAGYFKFKEEVEIEESDYLLEIINLWEEEVVSKFWEGYLQLASQAQFLPSEAELNRVVELFKLEKALYEALYEINNRIDWLRIPLKGILDSVASLN
ncbi:hypothetical protein MWH28_06170 [Natroniella sulfidigena]|uniref:hypothetical protein n=1 Tax=Natroniella sulfidigena TaxID=723921 RepID=UPI00200B2054|nr:hypothetical protein [Natroniella sulfidigena]MCK8816960.1 hypothetical protein [Natroniella sulfidigena]